MLVTLLQGYDILFEIGVRVISTICLGKEGHSVLVVYLYEYFIGFWSASLRGWWPPAPWRSVGSFAAWEKQQRGFT
jgi:hypothetical protein